MKNISLVLICVILFSLITGCRKDVSGESHISDVSSAKDIYAGVSNTDVITSSENQPLTNSAVSGESEKTAEPLKDNSVCLHSYKSTVISPSCNAGGYTDHVCTKCGNAYRDSITGAQHEFGKYLCEGCGKIDPAVNPIYGLSAWITTYGQPNGKGNFDCYPDEEADILIMTDYTYYMCFEYTDKANDIIFRLAFNDTKECSILFYNCDHTLRVGAGIKNIGLCSAMNFNISDFYSADDQPFDKEAFAAKCVPHIDEYMLTIQNQIIYPKTGLKLKDLGFTYYN